MELLQLKYFKTAAVLENISKAACANGIPQSAMSKTISRLEREIGASLFDRKGNRLYLNDHGRLFLAAIETALDSIEGAVKAIRDSDTVNGEIRLLVLCNRRLVTEKIASFRSTCPNVTFSISHSPHDNPKDFDFCITGKNHLPRDFQCEVLLEEKYKVAVGADHPLHDACMPVSLAALAHEKFVCMSDKTLLMKDTLTFFALAGINPVVSITCDDPYYVRQYVEMGMGIAIIPENSWGNLFDRNTMLLDIKESYAQRADVIGYRQNRRFTSAMHAFHTHMMS